VWVAAADGPSGACVVEVLQELMGRKLDLFVTPLCGPVVAGDQAHSMDTAEVPVDERVPGLGLLGAPSVSPRCQTEYSFRECDFKKAFSAKAFGCTSFHTLLSHVLMRVDQPPCALPRAR
jgi:hypothetical protein